MKSKQYYVSKKNIEVIVIGFCFAMLTACGSGGGGSTSVVSQITSPIYTLLAGYQQSTLGNSTTFDSPYGMAVDSSTNLFVVDHGNGTIQKISPTGSVTILAGTVVNHGVRGHADGIGAAASFDQPSGIVMDSSGTLYVTDTGNNTIRKISAAGVVSTFAGSVGMAGSLDGAGSAATFESPKGIAMDGSGTLYVTDSLNNTIRKIALDGNVTTFAGSAGSYGSSDGVGNAARFNYPTGIAVDKSGNLYVADSGNNTIRKISAAGVVSTLAGTAGIMGAVNGRGPSASFNLPEFIAIDSDNTLYVADVKNGSIRKVTAAGVVSTPINADAMSKILGFTTSGITGPSGIAILGKGKIAFSSLSAIYTATGI